MKFDPKTTSHVELSGKLNTSEDVIRENVDTNIRRGLPQVKPHAPNPNVALLVCSGASLKATERELVNAHWRGGKVIAVNGAYQWCIDHNIKPSAAIVMDARECNARFLAQDVPGCRYLLASQCHPGVFDVCKGRDVVVWHTCCGGDEEHERLKKYYFERTHPITLGTTVGVRSISLLRMLGFTRIEIFGLDSCFLDGEHHAFDQPENEKDKGFAVWLRPAGRDDLAQKFVCAPWHMKQVEDFQELIKARGNLFELNVHGDGLIAAMLHTGAQIYRET